MENNGGGSSNSSLRPRLTDYFCGTEYPIFVGFLVLLGHTLACETAATVSLFLITAIAVSVSLSIRPFLALLLLIPYVISREHGPGVPEFSDYFFTSYRPYLLIGSLLVLLGALAWFSYRQRIFRSALSSVPGIGSLSVFCLSLALGGLTAPAHTANDIFFGVLLGGSFFVPYVFLFLSLRSGRDKEILAYFVNLNLVSELLLFLEMLFLYASDPSLPKEEILFGWGTWTTVGSAIAVRIPMLLLGLRRRRGRAVYITSAVLSVVFLVLTKSRGAILAGALAIFLLALPLLARAIGRRALIGLFSAMVLTAVPLCIFGDLKLLPISFLSDNGRFEIWKKGISYFLSSPFFGAGYFSADYGTFTALAGMPDMAHNTVIQLLASAGLVGICAYIFYRRGTVRILLSAPTGDRAFLSLSAAVLLFGSLFDNFLFYITPLFHYSCVLAIAAYLGADEAKDD